MDEETDSQATRRQVLPNVTLDQEGVRNENLLRLRRSRRAAKGNVTRKITEITLCMSQSPLMEELLSKAQEFDKTIEAFKTAHANYHSMLSDEDEIQDSQDYYESECARIANFQESLHQFITKASAENYESEVRPQDSISNVGSRTHTRSRVSRASSRKSGGGSLAHVHGPRLAAAAKRAALQADAATLHKQQAIQQEELRLRQEVIKQQQLQEEAKLRLDQRKRQLDLEREIARAQAEEQTYANAELETASIKQPPGIPAQVLPLPLDQQPFSPKKPRPPMAPVETKPLENKYYDDVRLACHPEDGIKESTSSHGSSTGERFLQELIEIQREQQRHNESLLYLQESRDLQLQELLAQQNKLSLSLTLPSSEVQVFDGDPVNYYNFVQSFTNLIEAKTADSKMRLHYLVQYTRGDVHDLMKSCLAMEPERGYIEARRLLKERYGQGYKIATALVERLINGPPIKNEDCNALQKLSIALTNCKNILHDVGYLNKVDNPDSLQKIVRRLPLPLRRSWRDKADEITNNETREITFHDFSKFVDSKARAMAHPVFGDIKDDPRTGRKDSKGSTNRRGASFATVNNKQPDTSVGPTEVTRPPPSCPFCDSHHVLVRCRAFKKLRVAQRLQFVRSKGLCVNCLLPGHFVRECPKSSFCKISGCQSKHSTYLHPQRDAREPEETPPRENSNEHEVSIPDGNPESNAQSSFITTDSQCASIGAGKSATALPIVPVRVKAKGSSRSTVTYAFLDSGSNTTFCSNKLAETLGIEGEKTRLSLTTLGKQNCITSCNLLSLEVFDLDENYFVELPSVFSVPSLPVSNDSIPTQEDVISFPYLKDLQIQTIDSDIGLLIGCDVPKALEPHETRISQGQGPFATRTIFGWTVNGPLVRMGQPQPVCNFVKADEELNQQFRTFCNWEFSDSIYVSEPAMSKEDKRALSIMKESICLKEGHYQIDLPWKDDVPCLPNNRAMAEHRLKLLRRRLHKNPDLRLKYSAFMDSLFENRHAQMVPKTPLEHTAGVTWYLPHHPVVNPNKPNKVRVVFDCAARYNGVSLNSQLLQGPDLTNNLVGVLIRFREEPIAIMADIEGMFHQVRVSPKDCDALRFPWWPENDFNNDPEDYQMLVHLFGATSSPSCANFGLKQTADDNQEMFSEEAVRTLRRNFYVDDCLKSIKGETKAISLVSELRALLSKGGFRLTKWISNSRRVIESVPTSERAVSVKDHLLDQLPCERALGTRWDVETDTFGFKISLRDKPFTRRGILSIVSSIYDPLGLVAPFILPAKRLLQNLCRNGLGWDDIVSNEHITIWQSWLGDVPKLESLKVNRCFKPPDFGDVTTCQIHHFADASQVAYGAVSYLRITNARGLIHCSFVIGKSRLSPLKLLTIPRLELSAAVVAARLDRIIRTETDIQVDESVFWTDSTCVLGYLRNESRRFHTFVANRVATIQEVAPASQWRHVDSSQNPADDASRGLPAEALLNNSRWLRGPDFLWRPESSWPVAPSPVLEVSPADPEVKSTAEVYSQSTEIRVEPTNKIFERFSSWYGLKKFVAWLLRYRDNLRSAVEQRRSGYSAVTKKTKTVPITLDELRNAEKEIVRHVQEESFEEELAILRKASSTPLSGEQTSKRQVKKSSKIVKLDPRMIDGLLCVGGRIANGPFQQHVKHPVILPKSHHIVPLIIRQYHHVSGHSGVEHVLSLIREKFWIVGARTAVRRYLNTCVVCKRRQAHVGEQKMADLPLDRITPDKPPFTYVGVDCFGPFLIRRGRTEVKRYGVLYTCLVVRAVHIEVAHNLDTDSFLNSFRRFVARRGSPELVRSDNGGNFVSGERELNRSIKEWNLEKIADFLLQRNVQWAFNPPCGSHHGGPWECCIRTVRKVLNALAREQVLDDEGLSTFMCEAGSIVNSRPLTKVSDDVRDLEPLTPNHLLLCRYSQSFPSGIFAKEDIYSRRRWRQVQYLSDVFWRRWVKEYLPTLQERQKWFRPRRNFQVGDIVLLTDEKSPRGLWPLARVTGVKTNQRDRLVRSVTLKTKSSTLERPIDKIVLLEGAAEVAEEA